MKPVRIGVLGEFQEGKSLLINSLLGGDFAMVGNLLPTTPFAATYHWSERETVELHPVGNGEAKSFNSVAGFVKHLQVEHQSPAGQTRARQFAGARIGLPLDRLKLVTLIDTPGLNAPVIGPRPTAGTDEEKAIAELDGLDFALLVLPNGAFKRDSPIAALLDHIRERGIPCAIVLNCKHYEHWDPDHQENLAMVQQAGQGRDSIPVILDGILKHPRFRLVRIPSEKRSAGEVILRVNPAWHQAAEGFEIFGDSIKEWKERLEDKFKGRNPAPSPDEIRSLSRIPDLQKFLLPTPERAVGMNAYCLGTLHRMTTEWTTRVQAQIQATRTALNKQ